MTFSIDAFCDTWNFELHTFIFRVALNAFVVLPFLDISFLHSQSCFLGYKSYLILCSMAIFGIWKCKLKWCDHIMTKLLHSLNQLHASQYRRQIRNNKFHWSTPGETIGFFWQLPFYDLRSNHLEISCLTFWLMC